MKKGLIFVLLLSLTIVVVLCGCSNQGSNTAKLSPDFDEAKVKAAAENAIMLINSGDYQKLSDTMVRSDLRSKLSAEVLRDAADKTMGGAGEFKSFEAVTVSGTEDSAKNSYAVASVRAKYKNQTVIYTLSFDKEMQLVGLYMKQA